MSILLPNADIKSHQVNKNLTYNEIATKLIQDKFLLTALELHTELLESGRENKQLKDFFTNPGNFELQTQELPSRISRSGSQVTLDSLDLTRYSEDGAGTDERVAVLEFELRKAKETINALRNNLTVVTESECSTPDKGSLRNLNTSSIKPHEKRALNFLINEYLMLHGYKLTSITFADENQNQDFDDWDDVGLNISKPPELCNLYREGLKQTGQNSKSLGVQTDNFLANEHQQKTEDLEYENEKLKTKLAYLNTEHKELKSYNEWLKTENEMLSSFEKNNLVSAEKPVNITKDDSIESGESREKFEVIDKKSDSIEILEDNISIMSCHASDWSNISLNQDNKEYQKDGLDISKNLTNISKESFLKEIFSLCYINLPQKLDNEVLDNMFNESITNETLVHTVSDSLLKLIPNIILNKREEAIPLLISAVHLNPNASERDKLLQQLFNLKKKPSEVERQMILTGILAIAKCSGESLVENEILPQCWLQLTHKHVERRLLVAEACTVLIPYVSSPIRNSLILSMLQQMLDDKEESVRETVIKALSLLFSLCDDTDKYIQCENLVLSTLNDSSSIIVNLSTQILFPVLGRWSLKEGLLSSNLLKHLLQKFNNYLKDNDSPSKINHASDKILRIVNVLENLLPFLLMSVASNKNVLHNIEKDMAVELRSDFAKLCTNLTNPEKFYSSQFNCGMIIYEFDKYIAENPNESWPELDWILDMMLPDLFNNLNHIETNQHALLHSFMNLFSHICIIFGKNFTKFKIRPLLENQVQNLEQIISSFNQFCPSLNIIPVYLVSVLSYCDDLEGLSDTLKKFLCALPLCGTPLDCLEVTVRKLCEADLQEIVVNSLWEGVVHQRPLVRSSTAALFAGIVGMCEQPILSQKVTPALVTLASDNDVLVRTATLPALGNLITDCTIKEIHDKAYMQLQSYISDTNLRENHTLLRQLVVTLGNIVNSCTALFRNDVILPQLSALAEYMAQMANQTRKIDMALALVEAFTNIVYSPINKQNVNLLVLPGLKCLESVVTENQSLMSHRDTVLLMIKECDNRDSTRVSISSPPPYVEKGATKLSQNVNQGVEEMRQRVSSLFNKPNMSKPNSLPNLQGIFKKK